MKAMNPWRLFRVLALVAVLFVGAASVNTVDAKSLTLINRTGYDIIVLNCVPVHATTWWEDVLGDAVWFNGESVTIDFSQHAANSTLWDFKAHYNNGSSDSWYDVDVSRTSTIILNRDGTNDYL